MKWRRTLSATLAGLLVLCNGSVFGDVITFHKIAETGTAAPGQGNFTTFVPYPSISGNNVAFIGNYEGGSGVYTGVVGTTGAAKIVDTSDNAPGHGQFRGLVNQPPFQFPGISGNNVAFQARYKDGDLDAGSGVYTGVVGSTGATKIVDTPTAGINSPIFRSPSVSGNNVSFLREPDPTGVYVGTAGSAGGDKIVDVNDAAPGHGSFTSFGPPALSGNNVAFYGGYGAMPSTGELGSGGIYTGTVGQTGAAKIVDKGDGVFTAVGPPVISGNKVYFSGTESGGSGIYLGTAGMAGATKIVDASSAAPGGGSLEDIQDLSASGDSLVFSARHLSVAGIYLWSGGSVTKVIETGDTLFGSTVQSLINGATAIDGDKIAFWYIRTGAYGIGVAEISSVPEQSSFLLAGLALLANRLNAWRKSSRR